MIADRVENRLSAQVRAQHAARSLASRVLRSVPTVLVALATGCILAVYLGSMRPEIRPGAVPGPLPSSHDYAYGAQALLSGRYVVDWSGTAYVPRYPPGFPLLLLPAVAIGGVEAAVMVPYLAAAALALLAALVAVRVRGPIAAPLAVFLVLVPTATRAYAGEVMSDLPTAALAMLELALIAMGRGSRAWLAAGAVAGFLAVMRVEAGILLVAGAAAAVGGGQWRCRIRWYVLGAAPFLVFLGVWQTALYGSPLTTGYQALGKSGHHGFFSLQYALGRPANTEPGAMRKARVNLGEMPNPAFYAAQLLGEDNYITPTLAGLVERFEAGQFTARLPGSGPTAWGAGALGALGLVRLAVAPGVAGVVGRFGLALVASLLAVYAVYYYQAPRFMVVPGAFLNLGAALVLAEAIVLATRPLRQWLLAIWRRALSSVSAHEVGAAREARRLGMLLATSALVTSLYGVLTPHGEIPDGASHVAGVVWMAERYARSDSGAAAPPSARPLEEPLYYALAASAWAAVSRGVPLEERRGLEEGTLLASHPGFEPGLRPSRYLHTEQERFPFDGWARALYLTRLALLPIALGVVIVTYALARRVRPGSHLFALCCAASIGFLPQFVFLSSSIQNDILPALWAGMALLPIAELLRSGRMPPAQAVLLGLALAAGLWSRWSMLAIGPAVVASFLLAPAPRRELVKAAGWMAIGCLAAAGWLLPRLLGQLDPAATLGPAEASLVVASSPTWADPATVLAAAATLWASLIASFGWQTLALGPLQRLPYDLFGMLVIAGVALLVAQAARGRLEPFDRRCVAMLLAAVGGAVVWLALSSESGGSAQGRHLFVALPAIGVLVGLSLEAVARAARLTVQRMGLAASAFLLVAPIYAALVALWLLVPAFGSATIPGAASACVSPEFAEVRLDTYSQRQAERDRLRGLYGDRFDVVAFNAALAEGYPVQKARVLAGVPAC